MSVCVGACCVCVHACMCVGISMHGILKMCTLKECVSTQGLCGFGCSKYPLLLLLSSLLANDCQIENPFTPSTQLVLLFCRWLQLSMFLPGLEISVGPWQYDQEVLDMAVELFKNRTKIVVPILQTATKEFLRTGRFSPS